MKNIRLLPVTAVLALALTAASGLAASATSKFLLINPSPRVAALGNASTAACDDANAVFYMPSAMSFIEDLKLAFSYARWLDGMNHFSSFGVLPIGRAGAVGLGVVGLASGDIIGTSDAGGGLIQATGDNASGLGLAFMASYSIQVVPNLGVGTTLKLVSDRLENETSTAFASDLSVSWEQPVYNLRLGAAAQNLGTPGKFVKESFPLPMAFRVGGAYDLLLRSSNPVLSDVLFTLDGCYRPDEGLSAGGGSELNFLDMIFLRVGYEYRPANDTTGFKTGLGFRYSIVSAAAQTRLNLELDYGIELFRSFSPTHFIQAKISYLNFSDRVPARHQKTLRDADTYMSNVDTYNQAVPEYKKVLDAVPAHLRSAYNLACIAASQGNTGEALRWMSYILRYDHGSEMRRRFENDPDFDPIRESAGFKKLLLKFDSDR